METRYARWLAAARVYVGLLWLAYGTSKLEPNWFTRSGEFFEAAQYAATQIHGPMHDFIVRVVLPHAPLFAWLVAAGESLVGISLVLGAFKNAGAAGGMFLSLTYFFAMGKYGVRFGIESLEGLLFVFCLLILATPSAICWSVDAAIGDRDLRRR